MKGVRYINCKDYKEKINRRLKILYYRNYKLFNSLKRFGYLIAILIFYMIFKALIDYKYLEKDMMLRYSIGLVTIIIFLTEYMSSNTMKVDDNEHFAGYNLKNIEFYDNKIFNIYSKVALKPMLLIIFLIPLLFNFKDWINFDIREFLCYKYIRIVGINLKIFWLSTFVLCTFILFAVLIESVDFTKERFSELFHYKSLYGAEKLKIEEKAIDNFMEEFDELFKIALLNVSLKDFIKLSDNLISKILIQGTSYCKDIYDYQVFVENAFFGEERIIKDLINKLDVERDLNMSKSVKEIMDSETFRILVYLDAYFDTKWSIIEKNNPNINILIYFAENDLDIISLFSDYLSNKEIKDYDYNKEIEIIQNSDYKDNYIRLFGLGNFLIDKIIISLILKIKKLDYFKLINPHEIYDILIHLCKLSIDNKLIKNKIEQLFNTIFTKILYLGIDDYWDNGWIYNDLKSDKYMIKELRYKYIKEKLLKYDNIDKKKLTLLLDSIDKITAIAILFTILTNYKTSKELKYDLENYKVWRDKITTFQKYEDKDELTAHNFVDKIWDEIIKIEKPYQMDKEQFAKVWFSLFDNLDRKAIDKRHEYIINKNSVGMIRFSNYMVLKLMLSRIRNELIDLRDYEENEKSYLRHDLYGLKDILNYENIIFKFD